MKTDRRQIAAYVVITLFMAVTVGHVANYAGSFEADGWQWLGWLYALAVAGSIAICSQLTRWETTRRWATVGYALSVGACGLLNAAQVRPWSRDFGAWVYAIFPTVAQALLGFLARDAGTFRKSRDKDEVAAGLRAELKQARAEIERLKTEIAQPLGLQRATKADFERICAGMNGNAPDAPRGVNDLLNECGYYAVPDSTARTWARRETSE